MRFSVVVPFYNAAAFLPRAIGGLLAQEYPQSQYEILMVDDGSSDRSAEIVGAHSRIRLLSATGIGPYAARNQAMRHATGDIVAFTDADCVADHRWLAGIEAGFADPRVQVLLGRTRPDREEGIIRLLADYENEKASYVCQAANARQQYAFANNMAVRRSTWLTYGPFVEAMRGADVVFVRRVVDREPKGVVAYCRDMTIRHLEWTGAREYWRKMFTYGRSLERYREIVPAEPLTLEDRVQIFLRMAKHHQYGLGELIAATAGLAVGAAAFASGRLAGPSTESPKDRDSEISPTSFPPNLRT